MTTKRESTRAASDNGLDDYVIQVIDDPATLDSGAWDDLLSRQAAPTPFMSARYLMAMHTSRSACPRTGWTPRFVTLWSGMRLCAAAPAYLKTHSWGEYVFDWAWAEAYQRHGLRYYPKLLVAVPFTPVPGTRLMAESEPARDQLVNALHALARDARLSSAHVLFHDDADARALQHAGWLARHNVQFHWTRESAGAPRDFGEFLARMQHDKRKKINQQRRKVADAGVVFTVHEGARDRRRAVGLLPPLLHVDLPRPRLHALPDALVLRRDGLIDGRALGDVRGPRGRRADRRVVDRARSPNATPRSAATGARRGSWTACTSKPATTSRCSGASARASSASRAARRASTRWRAACCRRPPHRRTGWRTRRSRARSTSFCSPSATASLQYVDELNERLPFRREP